MNIILKAFDGAKYLPMLEAAFAGKKIGTCIYLTNLRDPAPPVTADRVIWRCATELREGKYPDVDWSSITPLDEELIEGMSGCERIFLSMMDRYARGGDIPYAERKRQYLAHLRYWNHILVTENIGLYMLNHAPHQCYDYVIYELCRLKGIPTYHLERCFILEATLVAANYEKSDPRIGQRFEELRKVYADPDTPIPLTPPFEEFYKTEPTKEEYPWFTGPRNETFALSGFLGKWLHRGWHVLLRNPGKFFRSIFSQNLWHRKFSQHRAMQFYNEHAQEPDFTQPYVYVPLHMQPEEYTSPRGGAFVNQEVGVQLLAAHLPPGVRLYVKEHPAQGELCRSEEFYRSLAELPCVTLVPRTCSTFRLIQHSKAVATATGSAGFEALFRGKPTIMFGHRFYQYAPGVHTVHTSEDCRRAIQRIFEKGETPSLRELKIFLKAVEDVSALSEGGPLKPGQLPRAERATLVGKLMHSTLAPLFH